MQKPTTFLSDVSNAAAGQFIDDFTRGLTGASFNQRGQLVGGVSGPGAGDLSKLQLDNPQSRFIISRLLRTASDATGGQCQIDCQTKSGITTLTTPYRDTSKFASLADAPGSNDHDRAVYILNAEISLRLQEKKNSTDTTVCPNIAPDASTTSSSLSIIG